METLGKPPNDSVWSNVPIFNPSSQIQSRKSRKQNQITSFNTKFHEVNESFIKLRSGLHMTFCIIPYRNIGSFD
ncbi:hypothetical protein H5410_022736 [Solanum commersonii]|uniref:Uncharacterized protein n=1 Tax=Solanum commersonii TaxID=4109 RepID=A0A9J5ZHM7_SOLCO|nr:hypothetical protein H5410_022736 [Solanum commersonii]